MRAQRHVCDQDGATRSKASSRFGLDGADGVACLTMHDEVRAAAGQKRFAKSCEDAEN